MSGKHDTLTEEDMRSYRMNPEVLALARSHLAARRRPGNASPPGFLDWGCGRGRSVAFLIQEGYCAFGVDTDRSVMHNGYPLFIARGLDPRNLLRHTDESGTFVDGSFDVIFSEETIEHIADLDSAAREMYRLVKPEGIAIHSFPGSRWLFEPHIGMPLVHWLPDNRWRRALIKLCLAVGFGPHPPWPEATDARLSGKSAVYSRYLADKTCYRTLGAIMAIFRRAGFHCQCLTPPVRSWRRLLPGSLLDNGFPSRRMLLYLIKPSTAKPPIHDQPPD